MANKHTSIAGLIYLGAAALSKIGTIWFPAHAAQFRETLDAVKELAIGYGFVMGADSPKPPNGVGTPPEPGGGNPLIKGTAMLLGVTLIYFIVR